ncbi:glycoside hydrolase family 108 protein [Bradyrhizobium sp. SZCCHNR2035]|uniref:glycoside hydrolase family 108 protein n=1 Tax=Bradyrhizobium sp. SZCCHNR2035 TaxID=3057386 RepID=UPI002916E830|nr:glycoside hydrolase family 108 protein [Bradyrhizobium sp. SZCCHNR2035]
MADGNFERCLRRVLGSEGRYSNHPADPGGATMWGITQRDYDAYRRLKGQPPRDVRLITIAERNEIYRKKYWNGARCDELPDGVDYCVFDGAVNSGVAQSVKWLQRALGVKDDGDIGDHTLLAAHGADPHEVIASICRQRRAFMRKLKTFPTFGNGWIRRVDRVEQVASAMAIPSLQDDHIPQHAAPTGCAKARTEDVASPPVNPTTATATTATVSAGAATVQTIQEQLSPFSETLSVMKFVLLACAVIGIGFTLYSLWKNAKLKEVV